MHGMTISLTTVHPELIISNQSRVSGLPLSERDLLELNCCEKRFRIQNRPKYSGVSTKVDCITEGKFRLLLTLLLRHHLEQATPSFWNYSLILIKSEHKQQADMVVRFVESETAMMIGENKFVTDKL